jgi:transposase
MSKTNVRRMELNAAELEAPERREGERSEPDRSAGASNSAGARLGNSTSSFADSEVSAKAQRRRFTADYKRSIVEQADAGQDSGAIGELLRREGLYSSHLSTWRRQCRQGELAALAPKKRGRKLTLNPLVVENRKLLVANAGLSKRLENAELIIEVQKKLAALLGNPIPETKIDEESE